jgi:hypothetical protein
LLGSLLSALVLMAGASSAKAHTTCTYHAGGDWACLLYDASAGIHTSIVGCDQDADGNYAYIRWYRNGAIQPSRLDPNGAGGACAVILRQEWAPGLDSYNICVQNEGCGAPVYWYDF